MIEIIGSVDEERLYCAGSFSKLLTTFATLSLLAENHRLNDIIDDPNLFDQLATTDLARQFLNYFQNTIGTQFTLHDICSFYTGMPYTFNVTADEIESVDTNHSFKHHRIIDETVFLNDCQHEITQVYPNRCKFNYSELSILFLGYFIEKAFDTSFENLYSKYVIDKFHLQNSIFSRMAIKQAYTQDLSKYYDLASIAIRDHGYFCYSNGFYTTLSDTKTLLEGMLEDPIFQLMTDIKNARAASSRLMNGLTVELRMHQDDLVIGYDGLSYSGCNLWAYSTKRKQGYLTFNDNGDLADKIIFEKLGYDSFDTVPEYTQRYYREFLKNYDFSMEKNIPLPKEFQGDYHRVEINDSVLDTIYHVTDHTIELRNTEMVIYDIISINGIYRIKCKDGVHGDMVGLHIAKSGNKYVSFGGFLLKKMTR